MTRREEFDPYESLANAIIVQAAADYRKAMRLLKRHSESFLARKDREEIERFFRSQWFCALSDADGAKILQMLKDEFPEVD